MKTTMKHRSLLIIAAGVISLGHLLEWLLSALFQLLLGLNSLQILSRVYFLPGILVNVVRQQLLSRKYQWYNRIDDTVVLGALPFRSQAEQLVRNENIKAVLSINEDYELQWFTPSSKEWQKFGVDHYQFSVVDRAPPSLDVITNALEVIHRYSQRNESVYIHCKSGRGRSATIVAGYVIKKYRWDPDVVIKLLKRIRPLVGPTKSQCRVLNSFHNEIRSIA